MAFCFKQCALTLVSALPLVLALAIYWTPSLFNEWEALFGYGNVQRYEVPPKLMQQFRMFDSNGDGYIDPYEYMALHNYLKTEATENVFNTTAVQFQFHDDFLVDGAEAIVVEAMMEPIVLSTMTKFKEEEMFYFGKPENILPGLLQWKQPYSPVQVYGAENFKCFLPPSEDWPIGSPYYIVDSAHHFGQDSSSRYYPPNPSSKEALLHTLLAQFHPNVFLHSRFGPFGSVAMVRATSGEMVDIVFRIHAEYQLNNENNFPFWYTPAQFTGRLIMSKTATHIDFFEFYLPTTKQLNIDMEWITGVQSNEVDIGYMPLMRLQANQPSLPWQPEMHVPEAGTPFDVNTMSWDEEISIDKALVVMEQTMYPFKQVLYHPFLEAVSQASTHAKLLHLILLWGSLDDQSC